MSGIEISKREQYFKIGLFSIAIGAVLFLVSRLILNIGVFDFIGFILFFAGIIVAFTNRK